MKFIFLDHPTTRGILAVNAGALEVLLQYIWCFRSGHTWIKHNMIVDVPYVTSDSEARDDDDSVGDENAIANKSVFKKRL